MSDLINSGKHIGKLQAKAAWQTAESLHLHSDVVLAAATASTEAVVTATSVDIVPGKGQKKSMEEKGEKGDEDDLKEALERKNAKAMTSAAAALEISLSRLKEDCLPMFEQVCWPFVASLDNFFDMRMYICIICISIH